MSGLQLNHIVKRFGDITVVQQLDLDVSDGEFVVLLGESGCGKSTTLRMVAGLEEPTEGSIHIGGSDVTRRAPMQRDIAMVFQNYALYPHMNVAQNMSFALRLAKRSRSDIDARVKAAAQVLGIEHLLERKPKELSGGQRQRVAIGRSIVRQPQVFLFDEPLSNLDAKLRGHMRAELALLHERLGKTTLYVTHDQVEAMTLADRIVIFDRGRIQQVGTPAEVFGRPASLFVAGFIGTPTMNFLPATLNEGGLLLADVPIAVPVPPQLAAAALRLGQKLTLGLRPHALKLWQSGAGEAGRLDVHVDVVEYLGTESVLVGHLAANSAVRLTAVTPGDASSLLHTRVRLAFDASSLHVFDSTTQLNLSRG